MKLRQIKKIRFWSLRISFGESMGACFDTDTQVIRKCRVVRCDDGIKWQLVKDAEYNYHYFNEDDQECLDNTPIDDVEIINDPMDKWRGIGQRGKSISKTNIWRIPF